MHLIAGTDMHHENILAVGENPVVVDLETLFQPSLLKRQNPTATEACASRIDNSVLFVGLMPVPMRTAEDEAYDSSGLGATEGQETHYRVPTAENVGRDDFRFVNSPPRTENLQSRPEKEGQISVEDVLDGFTNFCRLFVKKKKFLLGKKSPLLKFKTTPSRILARSTWVYGILTTDLTHPLLLKDALDAARYMNNLYNTLAERPDLAKFIRSEISQLSLGDIPYFSITAESRNCVGADGTVIRNAVKESGFHKVMQRIKDLCETRIKEETWFIRASIGYVDGYSRKPSKTSLSSTRDKNLKIAVDAGKEVLKNLIYAGNTANCLKIDCIPGKSPDKHKYAIHPADNGLYDGTAGMAFFLAYLSEETKNDIFKQGALALLKSIDKDNEKISIRTLSAFQGIGSLVYLYSHLGRIWKRADLLDKAEALLSAIDPLIEEDERFDIISGSAGTLLALLSLAHVYPKSDALNYARRCGNHLLSADANNTPGWKRTYFRLGFAHGASGISYALCKLYEATREDKYMNGAIASARFEKKIFGKGLWTDHQEKDGTAQQAWCNGAPGITLSRLALYKHNKKAAVQSGLQLAFDKALEPHIAPSQCLCHGILGDVETCLAALDANFSPKQAQKTMDSASKRVFKDMSSLGWIGAGAHETLSNGLMTGLSGIGYGLLRLRNPKGIPSILTLSPPIDKSVSCRGDCRKS